MREGKVLLICGQCCYVSEEREQGIEGIQEGLMQTHNVCLSRRRIMNQSEELFEHKRFLVGFSQNLEHLLNEAIHQSLVSRDFVNLASMPLQVLAHLFDDLSHIHQQLCLPLVDNVLYLFLLAQLESGEAGIWV